MSDYGIASNENDTISIEEEITRLGLKYSLVTKYTSFVAVDSNAITTNNEDIDDDSEDDDHLVNTFEIDLSPVKKAKEIIRIIGTVVEDGHLKFRLINIDNQHFKSLHLKVADINGRTMLFKFIDHKDSKDIHELVLPQLSNGTYFISLISGSELLDTEKFMIMN